ncbi:MAG: glutaminase A [Thermomicrobiales bacterium]|nr:glutaminase A [Thermomicrobiales bacterium]
MTAAPDASPISNGRLPLPGRVRELLYAAHERFRAVDEGENASVYPALADVPRHLFGICVAATDGATYAVGDAAAPFAIMSVSKPFVFALVCDALGAEAVRERIGVNSTGLPFNSIEAVERDANRLTNPMVNSGALATTSLAPGAGIEEKWDFLREGLSRFAGHPLALNEAVYDSASATNLRNRSIAGLLASYHRLYFDHLATTDLYTRQCSLDVTATDLAVMGATLANGGIHPLTGERVVSGDSCQRTLAVMATAGLYETSGDWLYDIGLPGKSGIGGGIVTVAPGKGGMGVFAPPLDAAGNSVKGQLVSRFLSERLGLNLFASRPENPSFSAATTGGTENQHA